MSSTAPIAASSDGSDRERQEFALVRRRQPCPQEQTPSQAVAKVATMTAMPPPCGVGSRCDERALGRASA